MEEVRKNFVAMPTLIRGTAEEEKDKALKCLETKNFALTKEVERLKAQAKRQRHLTANLEKWTCTTFMTVAAVDVALIIMLFFALAK